MDPPASGNQPGCCEVIEGRDSRAEAPPIEVARRSELEAIYREHQSFVWRNARRLGCDDATAEDVTHEVFLIVARRLSEFRHDSSFRTWLFAITYRVVQRLARDTARRGFLLGLYAALRQHDQAPPLEARSDAGEYLRYLLGRLEEGQRVVFIMAELEGMTASEIGHCLGLKPPTVESRLRASRLELARMLERERARERSSNR